MELNQSQSQSIIDAMDRLSATMSQMESFEPPAVLSVSPYDGRQAKCHPEHYPCPNHYDYCETPLTPEQIERNLSHIRNLRAKLKQNSMQSLKALRDDYMQVQTPREQRRLERQANHLKTLITNLDEKLAEPTQEEAA